MKLVKLVSGVSFFAGFFMLALAAGTCDYFEEIREFCVFPTKQALVGLVLIIFGVIGINMKGADNGEE